MTLIFCLQYIACQTLYQSDPRYSSLALARSRVAVRTAMRVLALMLIVLSLFTLSYMIGLERGIATGVILLSIAGSLNVLIVGFFSRHHIKIGLIYAAVYRILMSLRISSRPSL